MFLAPVFPQADLPSVYWWGFFPMQQLFETIAPCLPGLGWGLLGDFGDPKGSFFLNSGCSAQLCLLGELFYVQGLSECSCVYDYLCMYCMLMCVIVYSNYLCVHICGGRRIVTLCKALCVAIFFLLLG